MGNEGFGISRKDRNNEDWVSVESIKNLCACVLNTGQKSGVNRILGTTKADSVTERMQ